MKISIIGTHGIPARYGGFETFAEHIAACCVSNGFEVCVVNEKNHPENSFNGVEIKKSAYNKSETPLKFYKDSLKLAAGSDIILACGAGGSIFYSKARRNGSKIITNIDGIEHRRKKYSVFQRMAVFILQSLAVRKSDFVVADSLAVQKYWHFRFPKADEKVRMIPYGADPGYPFDESYLQGFKLQKGDYFLVVARLVPENNIHHIIRAYSDYLGEKKLVIVGPLENNKYVRDLMTMTGKNILFTDALYDKKALDSLRHGCFIYIHGHSVGGTNPSLLEAMAAGCACICHENVFNREATASTQIYFSSAGDLSVLLNLLEQKKANLDSLRKKSVERIMEAYSWKSVCDSYIQLFKKISS